MGERRRYLRHRSPPARPGHSRGEPPLQPRAAPQRAGGGGGCGAGGSPLSPAARNAASLPPFLLRLFIAPWCFQPKISPVGPGGCPVRWGVEGEGAGLRPPPRRGAGHGVPSRAAGPGPGRDSCRGAGLAWNAGAGRASRLLWKLAAPERRPQPRAAPQPPARPPGPRRAAAAGQRSQVRAAPPAAGGRRGLGRAPPPRAAGSGAQPGPPRARPPLPPRSLPAAARGPFGRTRRRPGVSFRRLRAPPPGSALRRPPPHSPGDL